MMLLLSLLPDPILGLSQRRTPVMGWSTWSVYGCDISEDQIKGQALAIEQLGLRKLGFEYIDIDDCWQAYHRGADGGLLANVSLFPSGMKAMAEWLHQRGFKLGLYSDAGTATCQGRMGSLGHEQADAATLAEWGVDLLKYDTCNQPAGTDPKMVYPKMGRALNATGRDIWYMMCEWGHANPAEGGAELALANSWRTGNDLMPLFPQFMQVAEGNSVWWQHAGPGHYNDPDDMALGFLFGARTANSTALAATISHAEAKLYVGTWALMKSPFILSVDFARNSAKPEGTHEWAAWIVPLVSNPHLIAISQDALSVQGHRLWSDGPKGNNRNASAVFVPAGDRELWVGPLAGGHAVMMLVNKGENRAVVNASFALAGTKFTPSACANVSVFDVFGERPLGGWQGGSFGMEVQPHSAEMIRIDCATRHHHRRQLTMARAKLDDESSTVTVVSTAVSTAELLVVDLRSADLPSRIAVLVCAGLFNRNETIAGAAYTVLSASDLAWLADVDGVTNPGFVSAEAFMARCLKPETGLTQGVIRYNATTQQIIIPNLITMAAVLDAVPLESGSAWAFAYHSCYVPVQY
eukprot:COSAG05_NODE_2613_length_2837_cov_1.206355_1_plen_580_part_00